MRPVCSGPGKNGQGSDKICNEGIICSLCKRLPKDKIECKCGTSMQCMVNGQYCKGFPKSFATETTVSENGYPIYRRREGDTFVKNGVTLDNRWIVPHNLQFSSLSRTIKDLTFDRLFRWFNAEMKLRL
jgi:hypothetical protein